VAGNGFLQGLGIEHPIIQAPMAGGPATPELAAAVSNAGGLGSLGAAYLTPVEISDAILRTRELTRKPFNVNLFAGGYDAAASADPTRMLNLLAKIHEELGLPPPALPVLSPDPFPAQLEAVLEARPAVFSFTFGIPPVGALRRLAKRDIATIGTATTAQEARLLEEAGVGAIVAQGAEAGAHRGTFAGPFEASMVPTLRLVEEIVNTVAAPVIASGGLMDGRDIAAAMARGASAAQLGTAFLPCPESGASEAYKRAILASVADTTVVTRAFSGRPARGLANAFVARLRGEEDAILPYPLQNALTRPMRSAATKSGNAGFLSLWAGTGAARARALPAGELIRRLVEEIRAAASAGGGA
jgi:nitronate monooxygenase